MNNVTTMISLLIQEDIKFSMEYESPQYIITIETGRTPICIKNWMDDQSEIQHTIQYDGQEIMTSESEATIQNQILIMLKLLGS